MHELVTFPNAKYDDQADSTSQALAWFSQRQIEPAHYVVMRQQYIQKLHSEGVPLAEIAAKVRKTPEEVQTIIDEHVRRGEADLKNSQTKQVTAAGSRRNSRQRHRVPEQGNPWMGTLVPK